MRNHIVFKFLAIFLCAVTLSTVLGCGAATVLLVDKGLYERTVDDIRADAEDSACWSLAAYLANRYILENLSNCSQEVRESSGYFSEPEYYYSHSYAVLLQDGGWYYTIEDDAGNTVAQSTELPAELAAPDYSVYRTQISGDYPFEIGYEEIYEDGEYPEDAAGRAVYDPDTGDYVTAPADENQKALRNFVFNKQYSAAAAASTPEFTGADGDPALDATPTAAPEDAVPTTMPAYGTLETYDGSIIDVLPGGVTIVYDSTCSVRDDDTGFLRIYYLKTQQSPIYTVTLYLAKNAFSGYNSAGWQLLATVREYRYWILGGLFAALLLFVIGFVYLCCAAGHRPGSDEVRPQALNRLPLDLYTAADAGIAALLVYLAVQIAEVMRSSTGGNMLPLGLLLALAVLVACTVAVGLLYAFAAQLKAGGGYWWRNSLIARVCALLWKAAKWLLKWVKTVFRAIGHGFARFGHACARLYDTLPLIWQWAVAAAAVFVLILAGILCMIGGHSFGVFLFGLMCFAGAAVILLYGAYAFGVLRKSAKQMAGGDLSTHVDERPLIGCFKAFAGDLNNLAGVAIEAAKSQMKSERMKAELITNVSHDIKTPLTSIINYVDLLQKAQTQEQVEEYLEVLSRQSLRMKKLIDDLMELSKASTGNLNVDVRSVDAAEAVRQALGEFADKLAAAQLSVVYRAPEAPIVMRADGRLCWRVLSNLLSNAVKYALPGTRVYVDLVAIEGRALISVKNISREMLNISADELMERFVRGDASRNTEGSGLGLNIAKNLMELQGGQLTLLIDGDLFKATAIFPLAQEE